MPRREQVLRQKLRKELEARQASIAYNKADLVEGNKTTSRAMELKLKREGELKKRMAAFAMFNRNASLARRLAGNSQAKKENNRILRIGHGRDPYKWKNTDRSDLARTHQAACYGLGLLNV